MYTITFSIIPLSLDNHESRTNCSRTYHQKSAQEYSFRKHLVLLLLTRYFGKTLEPSEASWISLLTQKICNYSVLIFRNIIYFYILTLYSANLLNQLIGFRRYICHRGLMLPKCLIEGTLPLTCANSIINSLRELILFSVSEFLSKFQHPTDQPVPGQKYVLLSEIAYQMKQSWSVY